MVFSVFPRRVWLCEVAFDSAVARSTAVTLPWKRWRKAAEDKSLLYPIQVLFALDFPFAFGSPASCAETSAQTNAKTAG
jgi:hypothetical protein